MVLINQIVPTVNTVSLMRSNACHEGPLGVLVKRVTNAFPMNVRTRSARHYWKMEINAAKTTNAWAGCNASMVSAARQRIKGGLKLKVYG